MFHSSVKFIKQQLFTVYAQNVCLLISICFHPLIIYQVS